MIHHMDEGIGRSCDALREHGLADNTLVVFTSDNGGERFSDNWPLVGGKMDLTEGGIRVPWIAHWPAVDRAGRRERAALPDDGLVGHDAGRCRRGSRTRDYPLDGVSLLPVLRDASHTLRAPAVLAHEPPRPARAARRATGSTCASTATSTCSTSRPTSASAPTVARASRSAWRRCASAWEDWNATMPPIPADATVSLGYSAKDMPQR